MSNVPGASAIAARSLHHHDGSISPDALERMEAYVSTMENTPLSRHPRWALVLSEALRHAPHCLEVVENGRTRGILPLIYLRTTLFGRLLVSLPYLNYGGVLADDDDVAKRLIHRAVELADQLRARKLEIRQETAVKHPQLTAPFCNKVSMRLSLPATPGALWDSLNAKVRNQVRKGQKNELTVHWGHEEILDEFYHVFSNNMRDLGTPVYTRKLFRCILRHFPEQAELCVVRLGEEPIACALLTHGWGMTEVPSASSLRKHNATCANMLMYWHLLERAIERKQAVFDFGRSTIDAGTYRFKKQWGAEPSRMEWQYYVRSGTVEDDRPDNPRYQRLIRAWRRLPVWLTKLLGPPIVRGIP